MAVTAVAGDLRGSGGGIGRDGIRLAVWLWGEHDASSKRVIQNLLGEAVDAIDDADVIVDLTDVAFMDASILTLLIDCRDGLTLRGRSMAVRSPQRGPRMVLELCGFGGLIEAHVTEADRTFAELAPRSVATAIETWVDVPPAEKGTEAVAAPIPTESHHQDAQVTRP